MKILPKRWQNIFEILPHRSILQERYKRFEQNAKIPEKKTPDIKPDQVLLGLTEGKILALPKFLPII